MRCHYIAGAVHLETGELLPFPSQRVPQADTANPFSSFSNHLFLHASDVCSGLRLKRGACTLLCNFHKIPPPPPPHLPVSEGANNPYTKVHSTYQFSYLLAASFIFLYQTGEKRTRLSYNHGSVVEQILHT